MLWMVLYSTFTGLFTAFFIATANALFLASFDVETLPWVYIAAAGVAYLMVTFFSWLERRATFGALLLITSSLLLTIVTGGWAAYVTWGHRWIAFMIFVALTPSISLVGLQFWGLAGRLFDLRQGKRLFGLVGSGSVVASMAGFFTIPLLLRYLEQPADLLLLSAAGMALSMVTISAIVRTFRGELLLISDDAGAPGAREGISDYLKERYFVLIGGAMVLLVLAFYLLDLSFLDQVQLRYQGSGQVAAFMGIFFGSLKLMELLFKSFVASRVLSQFGVRFGLLCLPAALFGFALAACFVGVLFGPELVWFYLLVAVSKMIWVIVRQSIYDPSLRVLFQPLPAERRLAFQAKLDVVGLTCTLAVGVGLLVTGRSGFNSLYLFGFLLFVYAGWMLIINKIHLRYRGKLLENLAAAVHGDPVKSPLELIKEQVRGGPPEDLSYFLNMLESVDPTAVEPLLAEKLDDVLPQVRVGILQRIEHMRAYGTLPAVERCAAAGSPPWVRDAARHTLETLSELGRLIGDEARLSAFVRSEEAAERELAATALGWTGQSRGLDELAELMWDRNLKVRRAAVAAAGRIGHPKFWPQVISYLASPQLAGAATFALITVGEPALPELELAFRRPDQAPEVKIRILNLYERIGGPKVQALVRDKLTDTDKAVRGGALRILSRLGLGDTSLSELVVREIEKTVGNTVWNLGALRDLGEDRETAEAREALRVEVEQNRGTIFMLLSLIYDPKAIDLVRENVENQIDEGTVYALEILDLLIAPELKPLVFPVLEDLPPAQTLRRVGRFYPEEHMSRIERLNAIVHREHARMGSWTKACAIQALGKLSREVPDMLVAMLFHPEPMLRELSGQKIWKLSPEDFARHVEKLRYEDRERIRRVARADGSENGDKTSSLFDKVTRMSRTHGFSRLSWDLLLKLAESAEDVTLEPGAQVPLEGDPEGTVYVVVEGFLAPVGAGTSGSRSVSVRSVIVARALTASMQAIEASRVLRLDGDRLLGLVADYAELLPAMMHAARRPSALTHGTMMSTRHTDAGTFRSIF